MTSDIIRERIHILETQPAWATQGVGGEDILSPNKNKTTTKLQRACKYQEAQWEVNGLE
jgi:hypothetical protein